MGFQRIPAFNHPSAPFLAFQPYRGCTIQIGCTQFLSWNSPSLHVTTLVIHWYAIVQHRDIYISFQVPQTNLGSCACANSMYQVLPPIFRAPVNKAIWNSVQECVVAKKIQPGSPEYNLRERVGSGYETQTCRQNHGVTFTRFTLVLH